jgi:adenosylcobinamide-GDP ribazoletransferase
VLRAEFGAALMLLTRLPAGWVIGARAFPEAVRCLWAYPVIGAAIGAAGGGVFALCRAVSMPPALAAIWSWAALALLTGALHEDGLADMADGFGGGRTRERKLEIMRDSRIGSYGVLALVLAMAVRIAALASMPRALPAMIAAGALSRAAMAAPAMLPAARSDGMGAGLGGVGWGPASASVGIGCLIGAAVLPAWAAMGAVVAAAASALAMAGLARAQIGGFTGDVLGGCAVVVECAVLTVLCCFG